MDMVNIYNNWMMIKWEMNIIIQEYLNKKNKCRINCCKIRKGQQKYKF